MKKQKEWKENKEIKNQLIHLGYKREFLKLETKVWYKTLEYSEEANDKKKKEQIGKLNWVGVWLFEAYNNLDPILGG